MTAADHEEWSQQMSSMTVPDALLESIEEAVWVEGRQGTLDEADSSGIDHFRPIGSCEPELLESSSLFETLWERSTLLWRLRTWAWDS